MSCRVTPGRGDLRRALGDAAKGQQQIAMLADKAEAGHRIEHAAIAEAEDMRKQHLCGGMGIGLMRGGEAADEIEEPPHLALRVVKPSGAGPAVRAAKDRLVAMRLAHAADLAGDQRISLVPGHLAIAVAAAPLAVITVKPAIAHHRRKDAAVPVPRGRKPATPDPRRARVVVQRAQRVTLDPVGAPMCCGVFHHPSFPPHDRAALDFYI